MRCANIFSQPVGVSFNFRPHFFHGAKIFLTWHSSIVYLCFCFLCQWSCIIRVLWSRSWRILSVFLNAFYVNRHNIEVIHLCVQYKRGFKLHFFSFCICLSSFPTMGCWRDSLYVIYHTQPLCPPKKKINCPCFVDIQMKSTVSVFL